RSHFFLRDTATTEFYTLSLHDALPIFDSRERRPGPSGSQPRVSMPADHRPESSSPASSPWRGHQARPRRPKPARATRASSAALRSEEHTSELQSPYDLVCRPLLEKKKA